MARVKLPSHINRGISTGEADLTACHVSKNELGLQKLNHSTMSQN